MRLLPEDALAVVTILQEAEGEVYLGKVAVAEVIRNRMRSRYSSDGTVAGTVLRPFQFSGWNANASNRVRCAQSDDGDAIVKDCAKAWGEAKGGTDIARGALLYLNPALAAPDWVSKSRHLIDIGHHSFYEPL
jgi:spore germination cell wall hydrolase CwlJ-like protein